MADEANLNGNGAAAAAPVAAPAVPVTERLSVPASAVFSDEERSMTPPEKPAGDQPAAKADETPVTGAATATDDSAAAAKATDDGSQPAADGAVKPAATPAAKADEKPAKIKVGDKEYTEDELKAELAKRAQPAAPAAAAPAAKPAAETPKAPTPEEIAQAETGWVSKFITDEKVNFPLSSDEMETVLSGGEDAVKVLTAKFNEICGKAVMLARKSIYREMNPVFAGINDRLNPVVKNQEQVEVAAAEHTFVTAYPDFKSQMDTVKSVTEALLQRYPQECAQMNQQQLMAEVASQADRILQQDYLRFNPSAKDTWRDALKRAVAPAAGAAGAAPVAAAAAKPTPAAGAAPARPAVPAPASNSPAAVPSGGGNQNWHKETAKSLAD